MSSKTVVAALAAVLACLVWTAGRGAQAPVAGRLPEGHARRQHAEPDGAGHRPGRARLLHRARRAPDDLEARHAADGDGGQGAGDAQPGERPARHRARAGLRVQQVGVPLLLAAAGQHAHAGRSRASRSTATRSTWRPSRRSSRSSTSAASAATRRGALCFGPDGSLYSSTGDNTNPFDSDGYDPIDEQPGREHWDAQRTAGNTNDLNGKILRIKPMRDPAGPPGVGHDVHDPGQQPLPRGHARRRGPEIFGMGFRNPFRFTVDKTTGWVLSADYGPDAGTTNANRGPQGSVEFNVALQAPATMAGRTASATTSPYNDYNFETSTSGAKFNCAAPVNDSPNNTGLTNLPPATGASAWMGFSDTDPRFRPTSAPAAPRWAARATTSTRRSTRIASSPPTTTTSGSSPSGTTAGSRPPTSTPPAR